MNYKKIYDQLILNAKNRNINSNIYYEEHHIKMRSHGGSDASENLVLLTAREHFIAHWLLWKIFKDPQTAFAWWSMVRNNTNNERRDKRYNISSRLYESAKHAMVSMLKNRNLSEETKTKISENSARKGKPNWNSGIKWKKKNYQKIMSEEKKKKIGDANRGVTKPKIQCPHYNKIGGIPAMKRFHFENCKELNNAHRS